MNYPPCPPNPHTILKEGNPFREGTISYSLYNSTHPSSREMYEAGVNAAREILLEMQDKCDKHNLYLHAALEIKRKLLV